MNWREEKPTDQDSFRAFLKNHKKEGKTLDKWVNWWMPPNVFIATEVQQLK
jgi:hypothetical protein